MSGITRLFTAFICIVLAAALICGCTGTTGPDHLHTAAPTHDAGAETEVPTDEPVLTEAPAETEAPAATEAPSGVFLEAVPFDTAFACDIDGDGGEDTVLIESRLVNEYGENDYTVNITLASDPESTYSDTLTYCYDGYAVLVDSDPEDAYRELLVCVWQDSDDGTTACYRVGADGGITACTGGYFVGDDAESVYFNGGLRLYTREAVLGTYDLYSAYKVTENGFESIDNVWYYGDEAREVMVINALPVTVTDSQTGETYGMSLDADTKIVPLETDLATYALVKLSSGEEAMIFFDNNEYGIPYINGRPQHDYLDVLYAD